MKTLSTSLKNLVKVLNDGEFHSGSSLGNTLNISRNAIWKHINQLSKYGIEIESAQSKGYRFKQPLILLDNKIIKKYISYSGELLPKKIELLGSIPSTNNYLKFKLATHASTTQICLAEHQTAGRGRFGRSWYSPFGANIYLSFNWCIAKDISKLNGLTLIIALAVMDALYAYGFKEYLTIKWPNDILWQNKKLGGVLTEINAETHGITQVVIGIGLNINMPAIAKNKIDRPWVAFNSITNSYHDRNIIAGLLISHILQNLEQFDREGFKNFNKRWQHYDHLFGKHVQLNIGKDTIKGAAAGINEQGHLLLQHTDGQITAHSAGEASLHK